MNHESPTPVLLIAGVNRTTDPRRRKQIQQELESIERSLRTEKRTTALRLVPEIPEEGVYLFDQFRQFQYQPEVAILHLSGYINGRYLRFDGGLGEDTMDPIGFADVLGRLPGLQVVFLSGCGHRELIEQLLLRDIPAIISLDIEGPGRKPAKEIAQRMYLELLQGSSIREAWLAVQVQFAGKFVYRKVHYDLDTNTLNWKGRDPDRPESEWGLYTLEDNEHRLDWGLPAATAASEAAAMQSNSGSKPKRKTGLRRAAIIGSSALMVIAAAALIYFFNVPQMVMSLFRADAPCVFLNDETYNILQLPLHLPDDCKSTDPTISESIRRRLEQLADSEDGDRDFQVKYIPNKCPIDLSEAEDMIRQCQADVILWGEYSRPTSGEVILNFQYLYATGEVSLDRGIMAVRMPEEQLKVDNDFINSGIEEVIYWARGNAHISRQEYEQALSFLSKIREQSNDNYLRVDVRMAQAYVELGMSEKALERYNHMLSIQSDNPAVFNDRGRLYFQIKDNDAAIHDFDQAILLRPDYADAIYNRGLVYMQMAKFSEAISDFQTVVRIQPSAGRPYTALAAIYAELNELENMYSNMERALERGQDIKSLLSFSAIKKFRQEERFAQLVEKFQ
ncbi:MAG: tetratricopeptide repeat protein [Bacteroidia bacterium]|nr:tetratricopeptide repeat protein [Bacteroidia bacterium]